MNERVKLSLSKATYRRTMKTENKIWELLHKYFRVNESLLTTTLVGEPDYEICNYPGLLSFLETEKLFEEKQINQFFVFEREAEPETPCPLFVNEERNPKEWEKYYRAATKYHQDRIKVLKPFIGKVIATIEAPIEVRIAN